MIAPRQSSSPVSEESDLIILPRVTVVSVQGVKLNVSTKLLVHESRYWINRLTQHARSLHELGLHTQQQQEAHPIVLDESARGLPVTPFEFLVYCGLLRSEEQTRTAVSIGLPPPDPTHWAFFQSFAPAGMPLPSAQVLNHVSRMAVFFGRMDLALRVPLPMMSPHQYLYPLLQQQQQPRPDLRPIDYSAPSYMVVQRQREIRAEQQALERLRRDQERQEQELQEQKRRELEQQVVISWQQQQERELLWESHQQEQREREQREQDIYAKLTLHMWDDNSAELTTGHNFFDTFGPAVTVGGGVNTDFQLPASVAPSTTETVSTTTSMTMSCSKMSNDPITLPPILSPPPSYFYNQPPDPPRPRRVSFEQPALEPMEPAVLSSPPQISLSTTASLFPTVTASTTCALQPTKTARTTSRFFPRTQLPQVDASQVEVPPINSPPQFPARFQSGRAATRRHHPYHRDNDASSSTGTTVPLGGSSSQQAQQNQHAQRHRLPDYPGQFTRETRPQVTGQQQASGSASEASGVNKGKGKRKADEKVEEEGEIRDNDRDERGRK
ncbi:hypothetical protein SEUCBS139899_007439 [Sporothrix eucalyptigena]|uniref:Uncharacterized protein n=1 Tax=Sporothrix eucalyptigena TaxID=1812306 RepID=A0ABP0B9T8_9PEZI